MLVLSRKIGHRIVIAGNIEITVVQIRGNNVRLGVTAPRHIHVHRFETQISRAELDPPLRIPGGYECSKLSR